MADPFALYKDGPATSSPVAYLQHLLGEAQRGEIEGFAFVGLRPGGGTVHAVIAPEGDGLRIVGAVAALNHDTLSNFRDWNRR